MKKVLKKASKPKVTLESFTITAIIPTEPYGNIQPAITVKAPSIEAAAEVVLPFINKLMGMYSANAPKHEAKVESKPVESKPVESKPVESSREQEPKPEPKGEAGMVSADDISVPYTKALAAIKTAHSLPALDMISDQIIFSKKLNDGEKIRLKPVLEARKIDLQSQL